MPETIWDVVVVGAGAAGFLAAIAAAERGRRTLLLEKNRKPGVKILMSGGTRCNLTHGTDNPGIVEAFGPPGKFLHSALAVLGVQETIDLFEAEGVSTKIEETGKVFPVSNKAVDVLNALLRRLNRSGAILALGEPVQGIERTGGGIMLSTPQRKISAAKVVLTVGGQSYPGSGTTGDGYGFAAKFGHRIVTPQPALVPITVAVEWVKDLQGVTIPDICLRVLEGDKTLATRRGSLLFAHFGLSGPAVLDVSRVIAKHPNPGSLFLEIDFLPFMKEPSLDDFLRNESGISGKKQLAGVLATHLPRRVAEVLLAQAGLPIDRKAAALRKEERGQLVQKVKRIRLPIKGTLGFKKAEVTTGG
ncbi:MAG TPA: aminoacetone oxidase family FAD-binding enzyme, partial [Gemmataceae bacterium]|nr:aminoacetone oxidase family FAD-binding enzyme [Gemmataceae bacterium]